MFLNLYMRIILLYINPILYGMDFTQSLFVVLLFVVEDDFRGIFFLAPTRMFLSHQEHC
jgi:hypothetical protein